MSSNSSGSVVGIIVLVIGGFFIYNTFIKSEWTALYEVSGTNDIQSGGTFSNKEECLEWLRNRSGMYQTINPECGKNCKAPSPDRPLGVYTCDETESL